MSGEAGIITELTDVHADNFSINKRVRDARRLLADERSPALAVVSGEITVTPKVGEGGGLWPIDEGGSGPTALVLHTINGMTNGDIIGIRFDSDGSASWIYVGNDGSAGSNCLFGPERLIDNGEIIWVYCDENGDIRLLSYEREWNLHTLIGFESGNAYTSDRHVYDMSGCTSYSVLAIQAPAGDGTYPEKIEIEVIVGNDDYHLRIIPVGCTLNGVLTTVEWSRLFMSGDRIVLTSNEDGTGWIVTEDDRKATGAGISNTVSQTGIVSGVQTEVEFNQAEFDKGNLVNLTDNSIIVRRDNLYQIDGVIMVNIGDQKKLSLFIQADGTDETREDYTCSTPANTTISAPCSAQIFLTEGQVITSEVLHDHGTDRTTVVSQRRPRLTVQELFHD